MQDIVQSLHAEADAEEEIPGHSGDSCIEIMREAANEIEMLSRIVYYYVNAGWPRYTDKEVPHEFPQGAMEVQSRALDRVRLRHHATMQKQTT